MKLVLFSDIHFGLSSNDEIHNENCLKFLEFVQEWCDENLTDDFTTIFLGDWYHQRNAINVKTMNYSKEGLITLSNIGVKQYMLIGNHDMFYKDRRDVHSIIIPEEASGIEIIDEPLMLQDMLLCPWLTEDEDLKDLISQYSPAYVFGHFELPSFPLNSMTIFPGEFNPMDYEGVKRICSGHFHQRSSKSNINYIGNCFSHNFADSNDWMNKGFCVLDTETNEMQCIEWNDAPKFSMMRMSKLSTLNMASNMSLKIINDINLKPLDLNNLRDELLKMGNFRDVYFVPIESESIIIDNKEQLENITDINSFIISLLSDMDTKDIDNNTLIKIYSEL